MYEPIPSGILTHSGLYTHTTHLAFTTGSHTHTDIMTADFATRASLFMVCLPPLHRFLFSKHSQPVMELLSSHDVLISSSTSHNLTPAFPLTFATHCCCLSTKSHHCQKHTKCLHKHEVYKEVAGSTWQRCPGFSVRARVRVRDLTCVRLCGRI